MRVVRYQNCFVFAAVNLAIIVLYNTRRRGSVMHVKYPKRVLMNEPVLESGSTTGPHLDSWSSPSLVSSCPVGSGDSGVLAAVMSAPANWRRRDLLRRTWARDNRITTRLGKGPYSMQNFLLSQGGGCECYSKS